MLNELHVDEKNWRKMWKDEDFACFIRIVLALACRFRLVFLVPNTYINPLTPNDLYISRTAPQTSKRCMSYIYSKNTGTEYFKHVL